MDRDRFFAIAREKMNKKPQPHYLTTKQLADTYHDYYMRIHSPIGIGRIESVSIAYTRRVEGRTITYYRIHIYGLSIRSIVTGENTQWAIS